MQQMESQINITNRFGEIVPCPECDGNVRVPFGVSFEAVVRCPRCDHEFELGLWLEEWVPTLEVVSDGNSEDADVLAIDVKKTDRTFEPINKVSDVRVAKPRFNSESSAVNRSSTKKRHGKGNRKRKRRSPSLGRKKNPKAEMIKMVLGGLLALPIAQLIIWWGLQQDPLKLAPTVDSVFPYVLPTKFQTAKSDEPSEEKLKLLEKANDNSDKFNASLSELNNPKLDDVLSGKKNNKDNGFNRSTDDDN